jgi:hypothetical protein
MANSSSIRATIAVATGSWGFNCTASGKYRSACDLSCAQDKAHYPESGIIPSESQTVQTRLDEMGMAAGRTPDKVL